MRIHSFLPLYGAGLQRAQHASEPVSLHLPLSTEQTAFVDRRLSSTAAMALAAQVRVRFGMDLKQRDVLLERLAYTYTHEYRQLFQAVLDDAREYLSGQKAQGNVGLVVIDLDDTLLDNRPFQKALLEGNEEYSTTAFMRWARQGSPAIPETLAFVRWLEAEDIPYCFITNRRDQDNLYELTEANLRKIGVTRHVGLYLRPEDNKMSTQDLKIKLRAQVAYEHKTPVIVSIGDQDADIVGPNVGRGFKLPNIIYQLH